MKIMIRDTPEYPEQPTQLNIPDKDVDRLIARGWRIKETKVETKIEPKVEKKAEADIFSEKDTHKRKRVE